MMPSAIRVLTSWELEQLGGRWARRRVLRAVERKLSSLVPPNGDGTLHDCATELICFFVHMRPWRRRNHRAAVEGTLILYRTNCYRVPDADAVARLVTDAAAGQLSKGALCTELEALSSVKRSS